MKEERKKRIQEVLKSIKNEAGEVEEAKLETAIEGIVDTETELIKPEVEKDPIVKEELTTEKITEMVKKEVEGIIDTKLKEAVVEIQKEIDALKAKMTEVEKGTVSDSKVIKEMAAVLNIDPSKALKGQDGEDDKVQKEKELDFGDRDGFGRRRFKEK